MIVRYCYLLPQSLNSLPCPSGYPEMTQAAAWHISWIRVSRKRSAESSTFVDNSIFENLSSP